VGYIRSLGASDVIERAALASPTDRPLQSERWAGVVDTVGGTTLANALAQTRYGGALAACGLAGGNDLPTTVLPFILRAITLVGVDSVMCSAERRAVAWGRISEQLSPALLDSLHEVRPMSEVVDLGEAVLAGAVRGRIVIDTQS
jgi:acrylyl-CoA reductase (NADPH)